MSTNGPYPRLGRLTKVMEGQKGSSPRPKHIGAHCTNIKGHVCSTRQPHPATVTCVTVGSLLTLSGLSLFIYKMGCCFSPHPTDTYCMFTGAKYWVHIQWRPWLCRHRKSRENLENNSSQTQCTTLYSEQHKVLQEM